MLLLGLMVISNQGMAAAEASPDFMRSIGKIYVVASVCLVILIALFIYIIRLDRKISQLEKRQKHE